MNDFSRASSTQRRQRRSQNRFAWSILLLVILVLGLVAGARWFIQQGIALGPTPTVTATRKLATETPTVDFRATQNVEEMATQRARQLAMAGIDTPTPQPTASSTPTPTDTPTIASVSDDTPTPPATVVVMLPGVIVQPSPTPDTGIPTATSDTVFVDTPTPLTTPSPAETETETPTAETPTAETPIATDTETPTATPFPTPTPTTIAQQVVTLQAFARQIFPVYAGPSLRYTKTADIPAGQRVVMQGRNQTGEWVYLCCELNVEGWTRQINLDIRENQLPSNAPVGATPDNVRWLLERQSTAVPLTPMPSQTPIPAADFPLLRRDRAGQAAVEQNFVTNWSADWSSTSVGSAFSSPVIVVDGRVIVANEDLHIYSFDAQLGNQRWRYAIQQLVRVAPAAQFADGMLDIYVVDQTGRVIALRDQGNSAAQLWATPLNVTPVNGINVAGEFVFVSGQNGGIYALNRFTGVIVWQIVTDGSSLQYPVVGDQLLYIGNQRLKAVDIFNNGVTVWETPGDLFSGVTAPPVYAYPGVTALSEVYVADLSGRVYAFDAANGTRLWVHSEPRRITGMALDQVRLYVSGDGFVKAINRSDGVSTWEYNLGTSIVGGPIVGNGQILFVSTGGYIQILNSVLGGLIAGVSSAASTVVGQAAVSGDRIFIPGANGVLYSMRERR